MGGGLLHGMRLGEVAPAKRKMRPVPTISGSDRPNLSAGVRPSTPFIYEAPSDHPHLHAWGVLYPTTTPADAGGKYTRYMHINDPLTATK